MKEQNNFNLNELAVSALRESAKWCMFLAIVGFIGIGLMLIAGLFVSAAMAAVPDDAYGSSMGMSSFAAIKGYIGAIYIVVALIYFFPVYYLFNYAKKMKEALQSFNENVLADALVNLKSHHKFLGIMTIIMISLYIIMIIGVIVFAASKAGGQM